jgi:magnesium-transporting ATPase (P-type)
VREIPFTSERKMIWRIVIDYEHNGETMLVSKGAPDVLLSLCTLVRLGMMVAPLDDACTERIVQDVDALFDATKRSRAT